MVSAYALSLDIKYPIMDPAKAILHLYQTRFMPSLMVLALQGRFTKLRQKFENEPNKALKNEILKNLKEVDNELTYLEQKDLLNAQERHRKDNAKKANVATKTQPELRPKAELPTP